VRRGYEELHRGDAWVDLSDYRGRIYATGEDRARLIHALTTNHVQQMKPGDRAYAFFLTAQGRILSDVNLVCYEDHLLLDIEPEMRETVWKHIDHYIIADDVTIEDVTERTFCYEIRGERVYGDRPGERPTGLVEATIDDARIFRIEHFHPRYGEDITSSTLPQETGLMRALHFNKGCYLGQEIVERIRSRGHVNRMLAGLTIDSVEAPSALTPVMFEGEEVGEITSSVYSPALGKACAIARLRIQAAKPGTVVEVAGARAITAAVS
jgi:folate-binding protein YgfZ